MSAAQKSRQRVWEHTFLGSDQVVARKFARPMARFLRVEAAAGILLLIGALAAIVWANSPWKESYEALWHTEAGFSIGSFSLELDLREWVNDAAMVLFFFVVGMEIKREVVVGELRDPKTAALPVVAALGGMLFPAAIFLALNAGSEASSGWGIPMATDIAFAVGLVSLLGSRVSVQLKLFLLTLAVADDLGAIAVIAVFYTADIRVEWLLVAVAVFLATFLARRARIWYIPVYVGLGVVAWFAVLESGVHATVAGVILGFLTPMHALRPDLHPERIAHDLEHQTELTAADVRAAAFEINESVPVAERIIGWLHPWTAYIIVPLFAFANAGVTLSAATIGEAVTSPITIGVFLGLVVGKTLGVFSFAWLAAKLGIGRLPQGTRLLDLLGIAAAAGVGFTVAIFVTELAFTDPFFKEEAKIGIFAASFVAGLLAILVLWVASKRMRPSERRLQERISEKFFQSEAAPAVSPPIEPASVDAAGDATSFVS